MLGYSVGRPKHDKVMITANEQDLFIGEVTVTAYIHQLNIHYRTNTKEY